MAVGDLAEFRARDVDRPSIPPDGFVVAVDDATDEVIGYACLIVSARGGVVEHDMTAVRRAWRGRGVGTAMKVATIRWAIDHGSARSRPATTKRTGRCRRSTRGWGMPAGRTS